MSNRVKSPPKPKKAVPKFGGQLESGGVVPISSGPNPTIATSKIKYPLRKVSK